MDEEVVATDTPVNAALDDEWEDAFCWSYGPRLWNVGCG